MTGAHAAGLAVLSGLGGPSVTPPVVEAHAITVSLVAENARSAGRLQETRGEARVTETIEHPATPAEPAHAPAMRLRSTRPRPAPLPPSAPAAAALDTAAPHVAAAPVKPPGAPVAAGTPAEAPSPALETPPSPPTPAVSRPGSAAASGQGNMAAARYDAAYLENPAPAYPRLSRRRGEEGKVVLRVQVRADGHPDRVEIVDSSGHPRLDETARETVSGWRFVPAREGDKPVLSSLLVPIVFRLDD